jgi:intracellular protein transport protein USO1
LVACADLIRGNYKIQAYFSTYLVPAGLLSPTPQVSRTSTPSGHKRSSSAPRTLVLDAIISMSLTSSAPYTYEQRLAACQCIQGFIHSNPEGRQGLITRLITTYHEDTTHSNPSNLLNYILDLTDSTRKDPYRIWFACIILLHLLYEFPVGKQLIREISIGDVDSGEEIVSSLQLINANLSSCLMNSYDPRISVGYLMLLSIWLYEDSTSVSEFLEETAGIQTLVGTIAQAREGVFVTGLAAVLLGICVEFNTLTSSLPPYLPISRNYD